MNEQSDYRPGGRPLTGRSVLLMIIAFFSVMLLVNFIMAAYAVKTFSGLDTDNPYDSGLAYNKDIAAAKAQGALGWSVELTRTPGRRGDASDRDRQGQVRPAGFGTRRVDAFLLPGDAQARSRGHRRARWPMASTPPPPCSSRAAGMSKSISSATASASIRTRNPLTVE